MFEEIEEQLKSTADRVAHLRKFLDVPKAQNRLTEIEGEMSQDNFWDKSDPSQSLQVDRLLSYLVFASQIPTLTRPYLSDFL